MEWPKRRRERAKSGCVSPDGSSTYGSAVAGSFLGDGKWEFAQASHPKIRLASLRVSSKKSWVQFCLNKTREEISRSEQIRKVRRFFEAESSRIGRSVKRKGPTMFCNLLIIGDRRGVGGLHEIDDSLANLEIFNTRNEKKVESKGGSRFI